VIDRKWFDASERFANHRRSLEGQAALAGWVAARGLRIPIEHLSVADCDAIVTAAFAAVCERVLLWDGQNDDSGPKEEPPRPAPSLDEAETGSPGGAMSTERYFVWVICAMSPGQTMASVYDAATGEQIYNAPIEVRISVVPEDENARLRRQLAAMTEERDTWRESYAMARGVTLDELLALHADRAARDARPGSPGADS
jgi:hypothetical protein